MPFTLWEVHLTVFWYDKDGKVEEFSDLRVLKYKNESYMWRGERRTDCKVFTQNALWFLLLFLYLNVNFGWLYVSMII